MVASYQGKLHEPKREQYPLTREFMSRSFLTVKPDDDIYAVMDLLLKKKATGAPVIGAEGQLAGMISEKDCLKMVVRDIYENQHHGGPVSHYMTTEVITVGPKHGLNRVAELFINHPFKKLPVVADGKLVGVVRRHEVLAQLQEFHRKRLYFMYQG